jgi:hypothetical protein
LSRNPPPRINSSTTTIKKVLKAAAPRWLV